jgi:hypothetical protein
MRHTCTISFCSDDESYCISNICGYNAGMSKKTIAVAMIVVLAVALAAVLRTTNRADAAAGNCYSDSQGPSEPTICN